MLNINQIPEKHLCSITGQIMIDPVMAADGHTYEREAIEKWLEEHDTSPKTNEILEDKKLRTNHDKRGSLLKFLDKHPELYQGNEVYLPKTWIAQLVIEIKSNNPHEVQRWLDKDRRLLTFNLYGDSTALHLACEFSSPELVDIILKNLKQKNQTVKPGAGGFKPIHLNVLLERALNNSDYAQCELLLRLGAEVEQPEPSTRNTLLHRITSNGNQKAVSWLLDQKAILESRNIDRNTPLLLSVINDQLDITEFLLKTNASLQAENIQQKTAFHIAVENDNIEMVKLLSIYGADPTAICGTDKLSTLHIAAECNDEAMLEYLLQTKAIDLIDFQNANGDTPLHLAVQAGHDNVISLLLKEGAYHKIKNEQDRTPIELAIFKEEPQRVNLIRRTVRELKKAKLKETDRLHQVVEQQANQTKHFRNESEKLKNALEIQTQSFKAMQDKMKKLEQQLRTSVLDVPIANSAELRFSCPATSGTKIAVITPAIAALSPTAAVSTPAVVTLNSTPAVSTPAVAALKPTVAISTPAVTALNPIPAISTPAVVTLNLTAAVSTPAIAALKPTVATGTPAVTALNPTPAVSAPAVAALKPAAAAM